MGATYYSAIFDPENVIEFHKETEFSQINHHQLMNFLPCIYDYRSDLLVLDTWKAHFERKGRPFAITRRRGERKREQEKKGDVREYFTFTLWKEDVATDRETGSH